MDGKSLPRFIRLTILVSLSCSICILTAAVSSRGGPVSRLPARVTDDARPFNPTHSGQSRATARIGGKLRSAISQPLQMEELSMEELFKAVLIHDLQKARKPPSVAATHRPPDIGAGAGRGRGGWSEFKLPHWLDYATTSRDHLVTFDAERPPVQLPTNARDLHDSIRSYAFNHYYLALNENHEASFFKGSDKELPRQSATDVWLDQVKPRTRTLTTHQVTKNALKAKDMALMWAARVEKQRPGSFDEAAVKASTTRTLNMWLNGMREATGFAYIPLEQIASKLLRR